MMYEQNVSEERNYKNSQTCQKYMLELLKDSPQHVQASGRHKEMAFGDCIAGMTELMQDWKASVR